MSNLAVAGSPHQITATYSGDDNNDPGSTTTAWSQTVAPAATTTALGSSANPSAQGSNVTFTATVSSSVGTPSGQVVFLANATPFSTNSLVGGMATVGTATLPSGTNTVAAQYAAQGNYSASAASLQQAVQAPVTCSATNAIAGIANNGNGTSTITFIGTPQAQYFILTSPDLSVPESNWWPVPGSTNTVTTFTGIWQFTVTNGAAQQFYRSAAIVPCQ